MRLLLLVSCVVAVVLAGTQVPLVRVAHYEPVLDFKVNSAQDQLSFNAYGKLWTFNIWLSQVTDKNLYHFHGRLANAPFNNIASFTLMPEHTTGMIVANNETFWLEAKDREDPSTLFIYKTSDVWFHPSVSNLECQTGKNHAAPNKHHGHHSHHSKRKDSFSVGVFKDQYWADGGNNPWASDDQTFGLLNDVNAVYLSSSNPSLAPFTFQLLGQRDNSWTTNDALNNMLNDFSNWNENAVDRSFNLVAWLVGNNVGGLAWVGTACNGGPHYRTSVSGLANFSRLWTVKTIAHELGHNRGANHDFDNQCNQGQTSGCQCSVMSYCFPSDSTAGGAVNYFSQTSKDQISTLQGQC